MQEERRLAERLSELEHKNSNELKLVKENDSQGVGELSEEEEEYDAELEDEEIEEEEDEGEECDAEYNITSNKQMEHCDVLEKEETEIKPMNRKIQQVADTNLLKENMIKNQVEIEAEMIEDRKGQVGESVKQFLISEVKEERFFDEETQQDDTEPIDKPFKENVSQDMRELSSEEKEEDEEEEQFDPEVVPFITQIENQDFCNQEDLEPKCYRAGVDCSYQEVKHVYLLLGQLQSLILNGKLNVYDDKDIINYKRRRKQENKFYSRWLF